MQDAAAADAEAIVKIGVATFTQSYGHSMPAEHIQAYLDAASPWSAILKHSASDQNQLSIARLNFALATKNVKAVGFIQIKLRTTEPCIPLTISIARQTSVGILKCEPKIWSLFWYFSFVEVAALVHRTNHKSTFQKYSSESLYASSISPNFRAQLITVCYPSINCL